MSDSQIGLSPSTLERYHKAKVKFDEQTRLLQTAIAHQVEALLGGGQKLTSSQIWRLLAPSKQVGFMEVLSTLKAMEAAGTIYGQSKNRELTWAMESIHQCNRRTHLSAFEPMAVPLGTYTCQAVCTICGAVWVAGTLAPVDKRERKEKVEKWLAGNR